MISFRSFEYNELTVRMEDQYYRNMAQYNKASNIKSNVCVSAPAALVPRPAKVWRAWPEWVPEQPSPSPSLSSAEPGDQVSTQGIGWWSTEHTGDWLVVHRAHRRLAGGQQSGEAIGRSCGRQDCDLFDGSVNQKRIGREVR